ncbi:RrF2 family transcriptional regulator [Bythopirellula polymerisocia]|uniref:HTH-type transcriptional repressor NsrR n=1 Tax=Bythopirellula polymerisocia TaxID=2528003 RepID=A0A5C6CDF5_9BACT|nr:Rrf2 family transcriptional regulator [Bythopirellula polymerisocia]TWU21767.1 HTH-type transcriptional repressor NsrR [Bythopirellula polymerisocia]
MITQTAEYALRAIVLLADKEEVISRLDIAEVTQVPSDYLTKVLQELVRAGIVNGQRGRGGGYSLVRSPEQLSVYDVVAVIAPLRRIETCPLGLSEHHKLCPLHKRLDEAAAQVEQALKQTTIAELIAKKQLQANCRFPNHL